MLKLERLYSLIVYLGPTIPFEKVLWTQYTSHIYEYRMEGSDGAYRSWSPTRNINALQNLEYGTLYLIEARYEELPFFVENTALPHPSMYVEEDNKSYIIGE